MLHPSMKPRYTHDCPKCKYLGSMLLRLGDSDSVDWYRCYGSDPSIIARYGNHGPCYWSMPPEMVRPRATKMYSTEEFFVDSMSVLASFMLSQSTNDQLTRS
jgi:hypothetical protein